MLSATWTWLKSCLGISKPRLSADQPYSAASASNELTPNAVQQAAHENHFVSFDENLLERARLQWHLGDWENLTKIDRDTLQHHPDRAKLALLVAAAYQQMNEPHSAAQFIRFAKDWGCSKKLMAQILVAGVHNTLGRAAVVLGDERRAQSHFAIAVQSGTIGMNSELLARNRAMNENARLAQHSTFAAQLATAHTQPAAPSNMVTSVPNTGAAASANDAVAAPNSEPMYPGIVSYAQNFEDVMLWRALRHVKNGFYIDVGAHHPMHDSVSKGFYEQGWRGIHVEALATYAKLLQEDRPDELVLQVAVAAQRGSLTFFEFPDFPGESTGNEQHAKTRQAQGINVATTEVQCITLADVFAKAEGREVHWLKIDVECMEAEVLAGWGQAATRPWIVVVESTLPHSTLENNHQWQHFLLEKAYRDVYFDGLNRFYISEQHPELAAAFRSGPNVFDNFRLNGTGGPYSELIHARNRQANAKLNKELAELKAKLSQQSGESEERHE